MELCSANGCSKGARWKNGYCSRHAAQVNKYGKVTNTLPSYRDPNQIIVDGQVAFVVLLNKRGVEVGRASFDSCLVESVSRLKWYLKSNGYVESRGKSAKAYLHRLVMAASDGQYVDHIDGNKLNNVRANLRLCSQSQNSANRDANKNSKTGMKGVHPFKGGPKFAAQITCKMRVYSLGVFGTAEQAKSAYDAKAQELFGGFAR